MPHLCFSHFGHSHIAYFVFIHLYLPFKTHQPLFPDIPVHIFANHYPNCHCHECDQLEIHTKQRITSSPRIYYWWARLCERAPSFLYFNTNPGLAEWLHTGTDIWLVIWLHQISNPPFSPTHCDTIILCLLVGWCGSIVSLCNLFNRNFISVGNYERTN